MRSSQFSDEQIIGMIKEQEAGMPTTEVCRKHGISTAWFYKYTDTSACHQCGQKPLQGARFPKVELGGIGRWSQSPNRISRPSGGSFHS